MDRKIWIQTRLLCAYRPITAGRTELFLSVLVPHSLTKHPEETVDDIESAIKHSGTFTYLCR